MKVLFLGGVFDDSHNEEIISKTRTYVEYAANNFQKKIIKGLKECDVDLDVVSAPFVGAYPNAYKDFYFRGFRNSSNDTSGYHYVSFLNVWGLRNPSRTRALKKALKSFIEYKDKDKLIIVYTPHTPLIQAANYAKRKDPNIKICLVVPDLPQYMNLADRISPVYKFLKKYDVKAFLRENKNVDSYVILTKHMAKPLEIGKRPYIVVEGIYQDSSDWGVKKRQIDKKTIVYTGKLDRSFGIMKLINAFMQIQNDAVELVVCGSGEEKEHVQEAANIDSRIKYMGQVSSDIARKLIVEGDILVNPRENNTDYTKYSFPSKIIDYLSTGNPVVAYKLDGMPVIYKEFITFVPDDTTESLRDTLIRVINMNEIEISNKCKRAHDYLVNELSEREVAKKILRLFEQDIRN